MKTVASILIMLSGMLLHEFHITFTLIEYNQSTEQIEVSIKLPLEDLEMALEEAGVESLYIGSPQELPEAEQYVEKYVFENVFLNFNGAEHALQWVGMEMSRDMHDLWVYAELKQSISPEGIQSVKVRNTLFFELFDDQNNTATIGLGKQKQAIIELFTDNREQEVKF